MTFEVSVLQVDAGAIGRLRDELHFDLAGASRVGFQLPGRPDVPRENKARGRFENEHSCPIASTAVNSDVVDVASNARFEDGFGDGDRQEVVFTRLDRVEFLDEQCEGPLDPRVDDDALPNRLHCRRRHDPCPPSSAINLYASNAWLQNMSSSDRSASMPSLFTRYTRRLPTARSETSPAHLSTLRC